MLVTPYGIREWGAATIVAIGLAVGAWALGWLWLVILIAIPWIAVLLFFRDPPRALPADLAPGDMICPADGVVSAIERVDHHAATDGPAVVVRIFLSVLNVHVNRAPFDAEVVAIDYKAGRFHDARSDACPIENESNLITLRLAASDETIGVRQIVGKLARRIVCGVKVGETVRRGDRFGMIKFGSSTELILPRPDDVKVHVQIGQQVRGVRTVLATLEPRV